MEACNLSVKIHGNPGTKLRSPLLLHGLTPACAASSTGLPPLCHHGRKRLKKDWEAGEDYRRKKTRS